jgi:hypothetical protein
MDNPWPSVRSALSTGGANGGAQALNGIAGRRQRSSAEGAARSLSVLIIPRKRGNAPSGPRRGKGDVESQNR